VVTFALESVKKRTVSIRQNVPPLHRCGRARARVFSISRRRPDTESERPRADRLRGKPRSLVALCISCFFQEAAAGYGMNDDFNKGGSFQLDDSFNRRPGFPKSRELNRDFGEKLDDSFNRRPGFPKSRELNRDFSEKLDDSFNRRPGFPKSRELNRDFSEKLDDSFNRRPGFPKSRELNRDFGEKLDGGYNRDGGDQQNADLSRGGKLRFDTSSNIRRVRRFAGGEPW